MAVITDTEVYQFGQLTYKNYTTLIDDRYDISIFENGPDYVPQTIAALSGDGDDLLNISTFRDFAGTISLGAGNDNLFLVSGSGNGRSGVVHGNAGNDFINGYMLSKLYGDAGNDTLSSSGEVFGGDGDDDVYSETNAYGGAGSDIVASLYGVATGDGGNDIVSSALNDAFGGDGNDTVRGLKAYGGNGDDQVTGDNFASGGAGNDIIVATGSATMIGGFGNDVFVFAKGQLGFSYDTRDKITDFEIGRDKIDLQAYVGADISFSHTSGYDLVKIDVNNDHKADFLIQVIVIGGGSMSLGDILLA